MIYFYALFMHLFFLPQQEKPMLLLNGTAHLGNGEKIENAALAFQDGKFTIVADATLIKLDLTKFEVVYVPNMHIYPLGKIKDKVCAKDMDSNTEVIKEEDEASFAILTAPVDQGGKVKTVYLHGKEIE
jgi:hypothetical protein